MAELNSEIAKDLHHNLHKDETWDKPSVFVYTLWSSHLWVNTELFQDWASAI